MIGVDIMKFCLSSRQTPEYLNRADEIRVQFRDYNQVYDLIDQYPNATIILNCQEFIDSKFQKALRDFVTLVPKRLILALFSFNDIETAQIYRIPFYMIHPIQTLEHLHSVKKLGVCYALIDNVLMHQLHEAKIIGVPLRAIPNIAHLDAIPREDGINGNWIRPENLESYSLYIDAIEFGSQPERREQALFRIYHDEHEFPGDLGKIVQDLNVTGVNRYLGDEIMLRRMNCNLNCTTIKNCTICYDSLRIASHPEVFEKGENEYV